MIEIVHSIIVLFFLCVIIFAFGVVIMRLTKTTSFSFGFICGFFFLYAISQIVLLPLTFMHSSLTVATYIWIGIVIGITVFSLIFNRQLCYAMINQAIICLRKPSALGIVAILFFIIQLFIVEYYWTTDYDDTYYTGVISTAVHTDSIQQYDPYTGDELTVFPVRYALAMYPIVSAIVCKLTSLNPILLTRIVLPFILLTVTYLIFYKIAQTLFNNKRNAIYLFIIILSIIFLFGNQSIYMPSVFLLTRIAQGKSIVSNILLPTLFLLIIHYLENTENKSNKLYFILLSIGSVAFSLTAAFVMPVALAAFFIPMTLFKKDIRIFISFVIFLIPYLFILGIYFLDVLGYLSIPM